MGIIIEIYLICDGCGDSFGVDTRLRSATEHRKHAKAEGWKRRGGRDYCQSCTPPKSINILKPER